MNTNHKLKSLLTASVFICVCALPAWAQKKPSKAGYVFIQYSYILGKITVTTRANETRIDIPKMDLSIYCGAPDFRVSIFSKNHKKVYSQSFPSYMKKGIESLSFIRSGEQWKVKLIKPGRKEKYANLTAKSFKPILPVKPDGRYLALVNFKCHRKIYRFLSHTLNTPQVWGLPLYYKRPNQDITLRKKGELTSLRLETFYAKKISNSKRLKPPKNYIPVKKERAVTQSGELTNQLKDAYNTWERKK